VNHNLSTILEKMYEKGVTGRLRRAILRSMAEPGENGPPTLTKISINVRASPSNVKPALTWLQEKEFVHLSKNKFNEKTYEITGKGIVFVLGFIDCDYEKILEKYPKYMPFIVEATFLPEEERREIIKSVHIVSFLSVDFSKVSSVKYDWPSIVTTLYNAYMPRIMQFLPEKTNRLVLTERFRKSICEEADRFEFHAKIMKKFAKCEQKGHSS